MGTDPKSDQAIQSDLIESASPEKIVVDVEVPSAAVPALAPPISPLQARLIKRRAIFSKHPRLVAGAWFATCAFIATLIFGHTIGSSVMDGSSIDVALVAAASALIPALLFGGGIANPNGVKSAWRAILRGALIVLTAHFLLPLIEIAWQWARYGPQSSMTSFIMMTWLFGTLIGGTVTFPCGCFAAFLLYKIRGIMLGPKGCAVHGYGMIEESKPRE